MPEHLDYKEMYTIAYKKYLPQSLLWIISLLRSVDGNEENIGVLSICQDKFIIDGNRNTSNSAL